MDDIQCKIVAFDYANMSLCVKLWYCVIEHYHKLKKCIRGQIKIIFKVYFILAYFQFNIAARTGKSLREKMSNQLNLTHCGVM